jgi:pyruvate dehydrogenase E1 component beta subunit
MSGPTEEGTTFLEALRSALRDAMTADADVVLLGEDIGLYGGAFGVTRGLLDEFGPQRVRDFPISEAAMAGMAVGASMLGLRPVIEVMFMDFATLTMDALCNHAAKVRYMFDGQYSAPLVLRAPMGAGRGYGPSHSQSLGAWFAHVPGIKVAAPASVADAYGLLRAAIDDPDPVLFLEHKLLYSLSSPDDPRAQEPPGFGRARVVRAGTDLAIVTFSHGVRTALAVADELAGRGVEAEVVDLRTIRPLDLDTPAASCARTGRAVVLTEEYPFCSIASELAAQLQERCWSELKAPVLRVTGEDTPIPNAISMEAAWLPSEARLTRAVDELLS